MRAHSMIVIAAVSVLFALPEVAHAERASPSSGDAKPGSGGLASDIHVNALGVLIFGATVTGEIGGSHWGVGARARWIDSGLYARKQIPTNEDESLTFSYGGGIGMRYYSGTQGPLTGFFIGPAFELAHVRLENDRAKIATVTSLAIPELEAGYRWRFGPWLLGLGLAGGYAVVLNKSVEDVNGGHNSAIYENNATNTVYGSVLGDVGVFF